MKNKTTILFDFDGTLFNSKKGIINAVKHAISFEGITDVDEDILESFIGPPLYPSFQKHFGFTKEKIDIVIVNFRKYYSTKGYKETELYKGVENMLKELKNQDKILAIATAKPTIFAKFILEDFKLTHFFDSIQGSRKNGELFPKQQIIGSVLKELEIFENDNCVMIGDTIYDIKGAQEHNIDAIGVTYGYGKEKDLKDAKANKIVHSVNELKNLLT